MIEIKCTQKEKETITKIFVDVPVCLIEYHYCHKYDDDCMQCLNDSIKWTIVKDK